MKGVIIIPWLLGILSVIIPVVLADDEIYYCNATVSCPESHPCCGTAVGQCGTGSYCLQCDRRYSYNETACMPNPICKNSKTTFSTKDVGEYSSFLGNASDSDWLYDGYLIDYDDGMIIAMPNQTSGTVIYSTRYMWYGKVTARFRSSRGKGVVSAFILYSDVQDEIDYEFVGADLYKVQTNFYYEGVLNYTNSRNITLNNTFENFHEYSIEWTEDEVVWSVDGEVGRTLKREDTYNETSGDYMFPQTPSKIELSLWPAGDSSNAIGTINWAGGDIDWDAADLKDPGYLYAILDSIEVECYDPPSGTLVTGDNAYVYNSTTDFSKDSIMITDDRTYLGSDYATGFDPSYGEEDEDDTESTTKKASTQVTTIKTTNSKGETTHQVSTKTVADTTSTSLTATGFVQNYGADSTSSASKGVAGFNDPSNGFLLSILSIIASLLF